MKIKSQHPGTVLTVLLIFVFAAGCRKNAAENKKDTFSFVFMTDIHLQPERDAVAGFTQALDTATSLNPDFIITGGDLIMDALGQRYSRADSLYNLYSEVSSGFMIPIYNSMGNHEIFGIYESSGADPSNPEFGEKMFENRLAKLYYSFDYKGWKFIILNSVEATAADGYMGLIDSTQVEWIREELTKTDPAIPIVLTTHIPFITAYSQKYIGSTQANSNSLVVVNAKEVIDLFEGYNLKLVLQGHLHTVEDIFIDGIHFVTGGAVSGAWWEGPNQGYQEGFIQVNIENGDFTWKYIDYGWEPAAAEKQIP